MIYIVLLNYSTIEQYIISWRRWWFWM